MIRLHVFQRFKRLTLQTWLAASTAVACVSPPREEASLQGIVVSTGTEVAGVERGPGAELCESLDPVHQHLASNDLSEARRDLDEMLAGFLPYQVPGKRVMSFGSQAEYLEYIEQDDDPGSIVPVDWCYHELFHLHGFIDASEEDYPSALERLAQSIRAGPTAAGPRVESGYILNRLRRFEEARRTYEEAIRLAERYPVSSDQLPLALRGLGISLIELGDLDGAAEAFRHSLEIDPGNDLAVHELRYIQTLRRNRL